MARAGWLGWVAAAPPAAPGRCRQVPSLTAASLAPGCLQVVMLAQEEARRLGHNFVGTEQILLGLIGESTGAC